MFHAVHDAHKARAIGRRDGYRRREPRTTVLYQTVAEHWNSKSIYRRRQRRRRQ
jgi:hypothetical protein